MKLDEHLKSIGACRQAIEWVGNTTAKIAWGTCENPGWMLWLIGNDSLLDKMKIVSIACDFAERALPTWTAKYPDDDRPAAAIKAARECMPGVSTAADAADAAARVARAARVADAAADAADAAARVARAAHVARAARVADAAAYAAYAARAADAADAAAYAAYAAYAARAADAADAAERKWQADRIRQYLPELKIEGVE